MTLSETQRGGAYVHLASDRASSLLAVRAARASTMAHCSSLRRERVDVVVYL